MRRLVLILATVGLSAAIPTAQPATPGTGTIFMGAYSGHILAVDEATEEVTKIPLVTGSPFAVRLSPDHQRFYVQSANQERFEVVDVRARRSLDSFTLSDARRHVRAMAFDVDPAHKFMVLVARTATKLSDRWEIGEPEFIQYDLTAHRVMKTVPWPDEAEPTYYRLTLRFSPDGKLLYVFGDRIVAYDVETFKQVDSWDLSTPDESGSGRLDPGSWDESADAPGRLTSLFTMNDAVMKRKLLVVGQVDMAAKSVDMFPLGPVPAGTLSFSIAPDRRRAYVLVEEIGHHELFTIDMTERRVASRMTIPGRPRMQIRASSNGQFLYVYQAGHTIDLHSPVDFARARTISLDSDMMYGTFFVLPSSGGPR